MNFGAYASPGGHHRHDDGHFTGVPHTHDDDPDYEYYEYEEDPSKNSFDLAEEEYIQFLYEYGHQDFSLLSFLPDIYAVPELISKRENNFIKKNKVQRAETLLGGNFEIDKPLDNGMLHLRMKKKQGKNKDSKKEQWEKLKAE